jgi:hypothetical protein
VTRALAMKEVMSKVYFDIEKACAKLPYNVTRRSTDWIVDFMFDQTFQVRVGLELSREYEVENGTPQGSAISPILFTWMIDDIFGNIGQGICRCRCHLDKRKKYSLSNIKCKVLLEQ